MAYLHSPDKVQFDPRVTNKLSPWLWNVSVQTSDTTRLPMGHRRFDERYRRKRHRIVMHAWERRKNVQSARRDTCEVPPSQSNILKPYVMAMLHGVWNIGEYLWRCSLLSIFSIQNWIDLKTYNFLFLIRKLFSQKQICNFATRKLSSICENLFPETGDTLRKARMRLAPDRLIYFCF